MWGWFVEAVEDRPDALVGCARGRIDLEVVGPEGMHKVAMTPDGADPPVPPIPLPLLEYLEGATHADP